MSQPAPFVKQELPQGGFIASNGSLQVIAPDAGSQIFFRRGQRGLQFGLVAEKIIPQLNQLSGDLLANPQMPASDLRARLHILMAGCDQPEPQNIECCVAELNGVRAYVQEGRVILTRQDILV